MQILDGIISGWKFIEIVDVVDWSVWSMMMVSVVGFVTESMSQICHIPICLCLHPWMTALMTSPGPCMEMLLLSGQKMVV